MISASFQSNFVHYKGRVCTTCKKKELSYKWTERFILKFPLFSVQRSKYKAGKFKILYIFLNLPSHDKGAGFSKFFLSFFIHLKLGN